MADTDRDRMVAIALGKFGAARHSPVRLAVTEAVDRLIAAGYTAPRIQFDPDKVRDWERQAVDALVRAGWSDITGDMTTCQAHEVATTVVQQVLLPALARVEASRRDWAAEATRLASICEYVRPELRMHPRVCACVTAEQAATLTASGFSAPVCAVHPKEVGG